MECNLTREKKRIDWADGVTDKIESVNYQGNNRILLSEVNGFHPFGIAMISPFPFFTDYRLIPPFYKVDAYYTENYIVSNWKKACGLMGIVSYDQSRLPPGMVLHQLTHQLTEYRITHVMNKWNGATPEGKA